MQLKWITGSVLMGQHGLHLGLSSGILSLPGLRCKLCEEDIQLALPSRLPHTVVCGQDDQEAQEIGKPLKPCRYERKPLQHTSTPQQGSIGPLRMGESAPVQGLEA